MTTKRTHGPCTCAFAFVYAVAPGAAMTGMEHAPDCRSLYPAQQEPGALTRLTREVHNLADLIGSGGIDVLLSLISEAREEQKRKQARERAIDADVAYTEVFRIWGDAVRAKQVADAVTKDPEP